MVKLRFHNSDEDKRDRELAEALRKYGRIEEIVINTENGSIEAEISVDKVDAFILIDQLKRNLVAEIGDHPNR